MSNIRLYVNNHIYTGWKTLNITRAIDQAATQFSVGLTSDFDFNIGVLPVAPGSACRLELEGSIIVTGFVDDISGSFSESSHSYTITGRSKIGDLIDSSAIVEGGEFRNQKIDAIAKAICLPFGINVVVAEGVDIGAPLEVHRVDDGGAHEVIERACRRRGLLLFSSVEGDLVIGDISNCQIGTDLIVGENVKSGSGQFSINNRFNQYRVKGQTNDNDDGSSTEQQVQAMGVAQDPTVKRYRALVIDAEDGDKNLTQRAQFEASTRLGRSIKMSYTVQGWRHSDGFWEPNKLVRVKDSYFGVDGLFLISSVNYRYGSSGTETEISVVPREAFKAKDLTKQNASIEQNWGDIFGDNSTAKINS